MSCSLCDQPYTADSKKIALDCQHEFHTNCFMANRIHTWCQEINRYCPTCDTPFQELPNSVDWWDDEAPTWPSTLEKIEQLQATDEGFKKDLKELSENAIAYRKWNARASKVFNLKRKEFREAIATMRQSIKQIKTAKLAEVRNHPDQKQQQSIHRKKGLLFGKFKRNYELGKRHLKRWVKHKNDQHALDAIQKGLLHGGSLDRNRQNWRFSPYRFSVRV